MKYGIRSVSMDDIARDLGISKKTLYQHLPNKAALVKACVQSHINMEEELINKVFSEDKNAIEEMVEVGRHVYKMLQAMNPRIIYDLKKYYRESWDLIEEHRINCIYVTILKNLEQGVAEGLYRANLNTALIARFYIEKSRVFIDEDIFPSTNTSPSDLYLEFFKYHIYGIASAKGNQYLKDNLATIKNNQYVK